MNPDMTKAAPGSAAPRPNLISATRRVTPDDDMTEPMLLGAAIDEFLARWPDLLDMVTDKPNIFAFKHRKARRAARGGLPPRGVGA